MATEPDKKDEYFRPPGPDLQIKAAARILGTDVPTVRKLIADGKLVAYQLTPKALRITRESLIEFRERGL